VSEWRGKAVPREEDNLQATRLILAAIRYTTLTGEMERAMAGAAHGIGRLDWTLETMHGKNVCDPLSNIPARTLQEAITRQDTLLHGAREKVIYLARHRATPEIAKLWKDGWWTVDRIFWGDYEHKQFTALSVPTAVGFKDSHECHLFAGHALRACTT